MIYLLAGQLVLTTGIVAFMAYLVSHAYRRGFEMVEASYERGRVDREALEDRLMSLLDPDALSHTKIYTHRLAEGSNIEVKYVDEQRELELQRSGNGASEE